MTLSEHQAEFTRDLTLLLLYVALYRSDLRVRLGYAERSIEEQQRLIDSGASALSNPEASSHVRRLAADLIVDRRDGSRWTYMTATEDYRDLGAMWERLSSHNRWGGRYHDGNHFERLLVERTLPPLVA